MTRASKSKKYSVDRTRLTWVLAALVASMTIGTVVLGVLEPHKMLKNAKTTYLAATYNTDSATKISRTSVPIETDLWQAIVIHTTRNSSPDDLSVRCVSNAKSGPVIAHFAIAPDASTLIGTRWYNQEPAAKHPGKILIAVQLADGQTDATPDQANELLTRIRDLQALCNIPASKVYVHSQLSGKSCSNPLYRYNWRKCLLP
jgi:hypothetical protein